jgi:predicted O-methyltransferase YrrM
LDWINEKANLYADAFSTAEEGLLAEISAFTASQHPEPHMLSGHVQGRLLQTLSRMARPSRILEIGTMTGYSALCLAEGLGEGGILHTLEKREQDAAIARAYFDRSSFKDKIIVHVGEALPIIETLKEVWDLVFLDADKVNYVHYYEAVLPRMRAGGIMIADNVLFHGQVLDEEIRGKNAKAIHAFNAHVQQDPRTENVLMTVRDGLMLILKK